VPIVENNHWLGACAVIVLEPNNQWLPVVACKREWRFVSVIENEKGALGATTRLLVVVLDTVTVLVDIPAVVDEIVVELVGKAQVGYTTLVVEKDGRVVMVVNILVVVVE
jgi:hypothetical protein